MYNVDFRYSRGKPRNKEKMAENDRKRTLGVKRDYRINVFGFLTNLSFNG
jgi:hypothetical protein